MIDPRLVADVAAAEGCSLTAYRDTLGNWTIGYGHLLEDPPQWNTIDAGTARNLLAQDLAARAAQAATLPEWPALDTPCRQNAVIECVFNLGLAHWEGFHATRAAIQAGNWQSAHDNLLNSPTWIAQVHLPRVQRLANYLLWGAYPGST